MSTIEKVKDTDVALFALITNLIVFLIGVPGNCLILRVYWTKTRKTSTNILIMALAWVDLFVCLLRLPRISVKVLELSGKNVSQVFDVVKSQNLILKSRHSKL